MEKGIAYRVSKIPDYCSALLTRMAYLGDRIEYFTYEKFTRNPQSRKNFILEQPKLSAVQRWVLDEINAKGVACIPFDQLFGSNHPLWNRLSELAKKFAESPEIENSSDINPDLGIDLDGKYKFIRKYSTRHRELSLSHPLIEFITNPLVMDIAHSYLGLWAKIKVVDLWYTLPQQSTKRIFSQNWHRDRDDRKIMKVFLYFSDVDQASGPTQYVIGSREGERYASLCPTVYGNRPGPEVYPNPKLIDFKVASKDLFTATGPRGTLMFIDTSGLHRGGFTNGKERLLGIWSYISPASLGSRRIWSLSDEDQLSTLSPKVQFALSRAHTRDWKEH